MPKSEYDKRAREQHRREKRETKRHKRSGHERGHKSSHVWAILFTIGAGIFWALTIFYLVQGFTLMGQLESGELGDEEDFWGSIFGIIVSPAIIGQAWGIAFWCGIPAIILTILMIIAWVKGW